MVGFFDASNALAGVADLVADLLAPGVWHVGLFIVATERHGRGDAQALWQALAGWMQQQGAQWLRLGVVENNPRGLRFWRRQGFIPLRDREGVEIAGRLHRVHVLARPVGVGLIEDYLALVPRDAPQRVGRTVASSACCIGPDRFLDLANATAVSKEDVRIAWERTYAELHVQLHALLRQARCTWCSGFRAEASRPGCCGTRARSATGPCCSKVRCRRDATARVRWPLRDKPAADVSRCGSTRLSSWRSSAMRAGPHCAHRPSCNRACAGCHGAPDG